MSCINNNINIKYINIVRIQKNLKKKKKKKNKKKKKKKKITLFDILNVSFIIY